jgi:RND family efflux transporter MFP subunit
MSARQMLAARALTVASAMTLAACGGEPPSANRPMALPVLVTTVGQVAQSEQREFTATVRARVETELAFRASGRVAKRQIDIGDRVKRGQALASLDAADHTLAVEAAADEMRAAAAEADQSAAEEARLRRLLVEGSISVADHERQKARADGAAARHDQTRRKLDLARNRTSYTTLVAPYAGVVTTLRMEVGQVVAEGQTVGTLARDGGREFVVDLPETLVMRVRQMKATATLWQGDNSPIALNLRELSPLASTATGTFRARYEIVGEERVLPLGATARLRMSADGAPGFVLPVSALIKARGSAGVWAVDAAASGVVFRPVQVQAFDADTVRVSGLEIGTRVVTVGAQKLDPEMKVIPVERQNARPSSDLMTLRSGT